MKKLSKITESVFDDIISRSKGDDERNEDKKSNIKDLKPVDLGTSVLWANKDLVFQDECLFNLDEVDEFLKMCKPLGWRLPKLKEIWELGRKTHIQVDDRVHVIYGDNEITFNKKGMWNTNFGSYLDEGIYYYGWTSDEYDRGSMHTFTFDDKKLLCTPEFNRNYGNTVINQDSDKLCIRLVRDK